MPQELENKIRERAYHLWVADGCRDGESERHWLAAEREVLAAFVSTAPAPASKGRSRSTAKAGVDALPKTPVPKPAAPKTAVPKTAAKVRRRA